MGEAKRRNGATRYFHGGHPGLKRGDLVLPQGPGKLARHRDNCTICQAQADGIDIGIDGPTRHTDKVYVTTDWLYAKFYASRFGSGDLYVVQPADDLALSDEDLFPVWRCSSATVLDVAERHVTLTRAERRALWNRWPLSPSQKAIAFSDWEAAVLSGRIV